MTKDRSIASVTVAYNGAAVLPRQLRALQRQTRNLDEIIVVDNASPDDSMHLLETGFPEVTVLSQPQNLGVGGGFSVGLDYAANQRKHDWIWLLDQDSLPADDALEQLLDAFDDMRDQADNVAVLAPLCTNEKSHLGYSGSIWRHGLRPPPFNIQHRPISFVDSVISSGTLLRRQAVEEAGLPRSDFFMDFVDHEYCLRLRGHGYKIAIVRDSRIEHAIGEPKTVNIFGIEKAWASHAPWREYYATRNEIFTAWKYDPHWRTKLTVARRLMRHAVAALLFAPQKLSCLAMMYRGFTDGRAGRLGIRSFERKKHSDYAR
jgi:GT2 family glycosyltransferase